MKICFFPDISMTLKSTKSFKSPLNLCVHLKDPNLEIKCIKSVNEPQPVMRCSVYVDGCQSDGRQQYPEKNNIYFFNKLKNNLKAHVKSVTYRQDASLNVLRDSSGTHVFSVVPCGRISSVDEPHVAVHISTNHQI